MILCVCLIIFLIILSIVYLKSLLNLYNVIYKIISKLIADRLRKCLGNVISEEHSGFVEGRQILDGVVIATETINSIASSKVKAMFIKLDMAKAYDRVWWSFVQKILRAFGFADEWVQWVMSCVTSTSFSRLINSDHTELFGAFRGLRQGDPLSPYLFILLAEGLGRMIKHNVGLGIIQGWKWGNDLQPQSHLQFVDDTTLMGLAWVREATNLHKVLDVYLAALGQLINEDKSSILFFNTPDCPYLEIPSWLSALDLFGYSYFSWQPS